MNINTSLGLFVSLAFVCFYASAASADGCGTAWQSAHSLPADVNNIHGVGYGNGRFIASVGIVGAFYDGFMVSTDGLSWSLSALLFGTHIYRDIMWDGSQFVAVGNQGAGVPAVVTSSDGVSWSAARPALETYHDLNAVAWNDLLYSVVGGRDAISLFAFTQDLGSWGNLTEESGELNSVVWSGDQFVAVGDSPYVPGFLVPPAIFTSPDGLDWDLQTTLDPLNPTTTQDLNAIAWGNNRFVAVGDGSVSFMEDLPAVILTSGDGVSWTLASSQTTQDLYDVARGTNRLVAVGEEDTILKNPDGLTSTEQAGMTHFGLFHLLGAEVAVLVPNPLSEG